MVLCRFGMDIFFSRLFTKRNEEWTSANNIARREPPFTGISYYFTWLVFVHFCIASIGIQMLLYALQHACTGQLNFWYVYQFSSVNLFIIFQNIRRFWRRRKYDERRKYIHMCVSCLASLLPIIMHSEGGCQINEKKKQNLANMNDRCLRILRLSCDKMWEYVGQWTIIMI